MEVMDVILRQKRGRRDGICGQKEEGKKMCFDTTHEVQETARYHVSEGRVIKTLMAVTKCIVFLQGQLFSTGSWSEPVS